MAAEKGTTLFTRQQLFPACFVLPSAVSLVLGDAMRTCESKTTVKAISGERIMRSLRKMLNGIMRNEGRIGSVCIHLKNTYVVALSQELRVLISDQRAVVNCLMRCLGEADSVILSA